ncbi:MAG TPA: copper transporter [Pseudonocardiaceae bacterium]|jgi:outer membrane murein-binding lipoprotein Lpp
MISLRYHVISIGAVFLALALGVVLGSTALSNTLLSGLSGQKDNLAAQVSDLQSQQAGLNGQLTDADQFATGIGPLAVRGALSQRTVALILAPDASQTQANQLGTLITAAGGTVTGTLQLTQNFTDPTQADQLRDLVTRLIPAGVQLPVASDPGTLAGGLIGPLVLLNKTNDTAQASQDAVAAVIAGLASGGFVKPGAQIQPAQLALVLTGGTETGNDPADRAAMLAEFAAQVQRSGAGTVLAGGSGSAGGSGAVGVLRADSANNSIVSSVDDVDTAAGRVTTVLALQQQLNGKAGAYGTAGNASSPVPEPVNN